MKESGIGRENGLEAFAACTCYAYPNQGIIVNQVDVFLSPDTQSKSTIVNIASPEETRKTDDWFADSDEVKRYG